MYRCSAVAILLIVGATTVFADDADFAVHCQTILDDAKRLRCYDQSTRPFDVNSDQTPPSMPIGIWVERIEKDADRETFTLTARKPNYFAYSYLRSPNHETYEFTGQAERLDNSEIKFQLSMQTKVVDDLFDKQVDLWFGYTQVAYWQLFNSAISAPFRETNYEPEVYASFLTNYHLLGLNGRVVNLGVVHESNGRAEPLSRSWNRVYAEFLYERNDFFLCLKPWLRISESADTDDNPDITDYMGNYEIQAYYHSHGHLFSAMARNVLDIENRNNIELQWSFPIMRRLRGLVQWYNGYGENLVDYNHYNNRISVGILMTDWL